MQDDSQKELAIIVRQPSVYPATYGTFYQFGRKDPLIRKSDPLDLAQGTFTKVSKKQAKDISLSIQNPNSVYSYRIGTDNTNWTISPHANLWSGGRIGDRNDKTMDVFKTIYDPSPARYKLPAINAFTGSATEYPPSNITSITDLKKFNVPNTEFNSGFYFYTALGPDNSVNVGGEIIWFSAAGLYHCGDTPSLQSIGTAGRYWSCFTSIDGSDGLSNSMSFSFDKNNLHTRRPMPRAFGFSARPVKE